MGATTRLLSPSGAWLWTRFAGRLPGRSPVAAEQAGFQGRGTFKSAVNRGRCWPSRPCQKSRPGIDERRKCD